MSRTKDQLLHEALVHFEAAQQYATADVLDQLVIDALCMRLSAGIDVLARLEPPVRDAMFGADWLLMWVCAIGSCTGTCWWTPRS